MDLIISLILIAPLVVGMVFRKERMMGYNLRDKSPNDRPVTDEEIYGVPDMSLLDYCPRCRNIMALVLDNENDDYMLWCEACGYGEM